MACCSNFLVRGLPYCCAALASVLLSSSFFNSVKPSFYALMVLSAERYGFRNGKALARFYASLDYIDRLFVQHGFLSQYYKIGAPEMDLFYFVRGCRT